jgi:hypothetical protein
MPTFLVVLGLMGMVFLHLFLSHCKRKQSPYVTHSVPLRSLVTCAQCWGDNILMSAVGT